MSSKTLTGLHDVPAQALWVILQKSGFGALRAQTGAATSSSSSFCTNENGKSSHSSINKLEDACTP